VAVYSKPVSHAFVIKADKVDKFLAQKADPKIMEMHRKRAALILKDDDRRADQ